jgi:hypothetical protein
MSDELDLMERLVPVATRCAQCDSPLPALIEQLAVVHGRDAELLTTCSVACLAGLILALAGQSREPTARRMN